MEIITDRINLFVKHLGISKNEFGKNIGVSSSLISQITTKKNNFRADIIQKISLAYPQLNIYWLLNGIGEMLISNHNYEPQDYPQLSNQTIDDERLSEIINDKIKKANFLYQRLIDIRVLSAELQGINIALSTDEETKLLWDLARPDLRKGEGDKEMLKYKHEIASHEEKIAINKQLDDCIDLFFASFFKEFKQVYTFLREQKDPNFKL